MAKTKIAVLWGLLIAMMVAWRGHLRYAQSARDEPLHTQHRHVYGDGAAGW